MDAGQGMLPTIFLIEEDDETRAVLKQSLRSDGYRLSIAIDEEDALDRVSNGLINFDLILINVVGKSVEETLQMGRRIREQAKFDGKTPLVVIAEKYGKDLEGTEKSIGNNDWILYLGEELEQLQNFLRRVTQQSLTSRRSTSGSD